MNQVRTLARQDVRRFYDRFGSKQDGQRFYEDAAIADLFEHLDLGNAKSVYEFGCGTGRVAEEMLERWLQSEATYVGVDVSSTMVALARARLTRFGARAAIRQIDGSDAFAGCDAPVDRIIMTYVLDLLPEAEIETFLSRARDFLRPGGKLGIISLTFGTTLLSRIISGGWMSIFRIAPSIVGGCRPLRVGGFVTPPLAIGHQAIVSQFGIASEVIVAE